MIPVALAVLTIGGAHHAINERYHPQADGFTRAHYVWCRRRSRTVVDCRLRLTNPPTTCNVGLTPPGDGLGGLIPVCERLDPNATATVTLRVHRDSVRKLP